jgi:ribose-phosphate pyrophosphokinase
MFSLEEQADPFAHALAEGLGVMLAGHEDRLFQDGERRLRPLVSPRNADAYVLCSLHGGPQESPHDKLCRLLMFIATLRDHGAAHVTAVVPYMAYARKDRQTQPFDPLSLRYVAQMFEALGTARVIVLEAHNVAALQNAFRCEAMNLDAHGAFSGVAAELAATGERLVVASPDPGGVKRAQLWRESLEEGLGCDVGFAMVDRRRSSGLASSSCLVAGDVSGASVLLLDDLIASGETMQRGAVALRRAGAVRVIACATHGLFIDHAARALTDEHIDQVIVTDSVPSFRLPAAGPVRHKLRTVTCVPLFVEAIRTCHERW